MNRVHDSLHKVLQRNRLVFWYDSTGEWGETFEAFADPQVVKLKVARNEFGTKVRVVRDPASAAKFLLYVPTSRPADVDNWLLDLLLQGYEFRADKASLVLQEVGLPHEFLHLAEEHAAFFRSEKRTLALKDLLGKDDQARDIRLKMMAVLTSAPTVEIDAMLLGFLDSTAENLLFDPVAETLESAALVEVFWREVERVFGYASTMPSVRDFAVSLFRGANPLDAQVVLHSHAKVFLQRWKDSQAHCISFRKWATQMERELQIDVSLITLEESATLGDADTFEAFEKFTIHRLCRSFERGAAAADLRAVIQQRRSSFWQQEHEHGYGALEQAIDLRELLASVELNVDSLSAGMSRYVSNWWRIDMAYRRCTWHLRLYGQVQLMERINQWVEKAYVNNFLLPLTDRWSDQVRRLETWECAGLAQHNAASFRNTSNRFEQRTRKFLSSFRMPFVMKRQQNSRSDFVPRTDGLQK